MDVSRRAGEDGTAMKPEGVVFNVVTALSAKAAAVVGVLDWEAHGWAAAPPTP
jgi:hypothetical protein